MKTNKKILITKILMSGIFLFSIIISCSRQPNPFSKVTQAPNVIDKIYPFSYDVYWDGMNYYARFDWELYNPDYDFSFIVGPDVTARWNDGSISVPNNMWIETRYGWSNSVLGFRVHEENVNVTGMVHKTGSSDTFVPTIHSLSGPNNGETYGPDYLPDIRLIVYDTGGPSDGISIQRNYSIRMVDVYGNTSDALNTSVKYVQLDANFVDSASWYASGFGTYHVHINCGVVIRSNVSGPDTYEVKLSFNPFDFMFWWTWFPVDEWVLQNINMNDNAGNVGGISLTYPSNLYNDNSSSPIIKFKVVK